MSANLNAREYVYLAPSGTHHPSIHHRRFNMTDSIKDDLAWPQYSSALPPISDISDIVRCISDNGPANINVSSTTVIYAKSSINVGLKYYGKMAKFKCHLRDQDMDSALGGVSAVLANGQSQPLYAITNRDLFSGSRDCGQDVVKHKAHTFQSLPPGEYRLRLQALTLTYNKDGYLIIRHPEILLTPDGDPSKGFSKSYYLDVENEAKYIDEWFTIIVTG